MSVQYLVGDTRELIATIPDDSVSLITTSPPFYQLRSYLQGDHSDKALEIGSEPDPATFIDTLLTLTAEWGRVLAPWGSLAIELGDTYSGSGGAGGDYNEGGLHEGQGKFEGSARAQRRSVNGAIKANPKCLAMIPELYRVALAYGFNPLTGAPSPAGKWLIRNVICWHRPNPAVGALGDKVRPSTSYIVIATRSPKRWFDLTAVRHDHTVPNGGPLRGRAAQTAGMNSDAGATWEPGERLAINPAGAPPLDTWFDQYDGTHDTWTLTTQPSPLAHYAMWPAKLAERLILMMCPREVCRVCGEPRRRVETGDGPTLLANRELVGYRSRDGREVGVSRPHFLSSNPTTLGWTDCGCICSTCNGKHWIPDDPTNTTDSECPDCTNGHDDYRLGLVLDPFCGSATTMCVADLHGRDAIGIDIDARNQAIYPARYDEVKRALFGTPAPMPGQGVLAL